MRIFSLFVGVVAAHPVSLNYELVESIAAQVRSLNQLELAHLRLAALKSTELCSEHGDTLELKATWDKYVKDKYAKAAVPKLVPFAEAVDLIGDSAPYDKKSVEMDRRLAEASSGEASSGTDDPVVIIVTTSSEDVDFWTTDELDKVETKMAALASVDQNRVRIEVSGGSSVLTITIEAFSTKQASDLSAVLHDQLDTEALVKSNLGIDSATGGAVVRVDGFAAPPSSPPPPPSGDDGLSGGAIAGIVIAMLIVALIIFVAIVFRVQILEKCNCMAPSDGRASLTENDGGDREGGKVGEVGILLTGNSKI